jgi:hypothetical protein
MWLNEMIYPDESLYSISSRIVLTHPSSCFGDAYEYLWGTKNIQLDAVFPSNLPQLSQLTNKPVSYLIKHHSTINYYGMFADKEKLSLTLSDLEKGIGKYAASILSITANCLEASSSLKYCPVCAARDVDSFGVAYWHRFHQLPAVEICIEHHMRLIHIDRSRKVPIMPPQYTFSEADENINSDEFWWTKVSTEVLHSSSDTRVEQAQFIKCLKVRLFFKGFITPSFHIRQQEWGYALKRYWQGLEEQQLINEAINSASGGNHFPQYLAYDHNNYFHPVKYLLVIGHLFDGIDDFLEAYGCCDKELSLIISGQNKVKHKQVEQGTNERLIVKKLNNGSSLRAVAKFFHRSVLFIKKIAEINGIAIRRREQILFAKERHKILLQLSAGDPTEIIAKSFGVCQGAIERILSSAPDVVVKRKAQRFLTKQKGERSLFLKFLAKHSGCSRNTIRKLIASTYIWLFKNDKKWLYLNLPEAVPRCERRGCRSAKVVKRGGYE